VFGKYERNIQRMSSVELLQYFGYCAQNKASGVDETLDNEQVF
jgi:hypothetical protein